MSKPVLQAFYGMSSPWAYLGAQRLVAIARDAGATLVHRPIRLIEANGGIPLRTRPDYRQKYHEVELDRWRKHLGIPLNLKPKFYPCRTIETAAQAVIAVQKAGIEVADFAFAIQRALWAENHDIADLATLRELALATVGEAGAALVRDPQPDDIVVSPYGHAIGGHANLAEAEERGIFGTPTYVVNDELFWGQDRLDFVARALADAKQKEVA